MRSTNAALGRYGTTVFEVISSLAREKQAINLGQGFPEDGVPEDVVAQAAAALTRHPNQYAPMLGVPELRRAVAAHEKRFYGLEVDWQREVMITSGATEALAAVFLAVLEAGDEVVLFEPAYDCYMPMAERADAVAKVVRLTPPRWDVPTEALAAAFGPKTKLVVVNTPMNPIGKVFTTAELDTIAQLAQKYDAYVLCDEVYEHLVFPPARHVPLMTRPNMFDRCMRIASSGKTFSLTGWKVGSITAPATLIERIARAHQFLVFCTPPNLQHAVAYGLQKDDRYFAHLADFMRQKRDRFLAGLASVGLPASASDGTYFATADITSLGFTDDMAFCKLLIDKCAVAAIPLSAFYGRDPHRTHVRFCFAKRDAVLDEAVQRLRTLKGAA